jgi:hypothetical protein
VITWWLSSRIHRSLLRAAEMAEQAVGVASERYDRGGAMDDDHRAV